MLCGGISAVMEKWRDVSQSFDFQVKERSRDVWQCNGFVMQ